MNPLLDLAPQRLAQHLQFLLAERFFSLAAVESSEELRDLMWRGVVDVLFEVYATGTDESGVEAVDVIGREEQDALRRGGGDAVEGVE